MEAKSEWRLWMRPITQYERELKKFESMVDLERAHQAPDDIFIYRTFAK